MVICIEMHSSWPPSWSAPLSTLQLPSEASIHLEGVCLWKIVNILSRSNLFLLKKGFHVWAQQMIMSYAHAVLYVPKDCKLPGNQFLFTTLSLSDTHLESAGWTVSARRNSGGVFFHKKFLKKKSTYDPTLLRWHRSEIHRQFWWVLVALHYLGENISTQVRAERELDNGDRTEKTMTEENEE